MPDKSRLIAGVLFFVLAAQFLTILMIGESLVPGYSVHENAISDLGVASQIAPLFNSSLLLVGLLEILAAAYFHRIHHSRSVTAVFLLAGIGAMGAAVFTLESSAHGLFALMAFLFSNLAAITCWTVFRGPFRIISLAAESLGLFFWRS